MREPFLLVLSILFYLLFQVFIQCDSRRSRRSADKGWVRMQSSSSRLCRALWGVNSCAGGQVAPRSCQGWIKVELLTKVQVEGPACPPTVLLSDVLEGHATTTFVLAHSPDSHQHSCWFLLVWKGAPCILRLQFGKLVLEGLAVWKMGGRIQRDGVLSTISTHMSAQLPDDLQPRQTSRLPEL